MNKVYKKSGLISELIFHNINIFSSLKQEKKKRKTQLFTF